MTSASADCGRVTAAGIWGVRQVEVKWKVFFNISFSSRFHTPPLTAFIQKRWTRKVTAVDRSGVRYTVL